MDYLAAGASYSKNAVPATSLNILVARRIGTSLYSFTLMDVLPKSTQTATAMVSITTGLGQKIREIGPVKIFLVASIGGAAGGQDIGWSYSTGGCLIIPLGKGGISLMPNFRALKTSISDYQGIFGIMIGFGK
jgi:hypothetical protein